MAIVYKDKEYRNLQEQVFKNMKDIQDMKSTGLVLDEFGIKVIGQVPTEDDLPGGQDFEFGDAYAVGTETPYELWIWTRTTEDATEGYWFNIGTFPLAGPQGETGATPNISANAAARMVSGYAGARVVVSGTPENPVMSFQFDIPQGLKGDKGDTGATGAQGPQGPAGQDGATGPQGPKGDTGSSYEILGQVDSTADLPSPTSVSRTGAYLVGTTLPYDLYVNTGSDWIDAGSVSQGPRGPEGPQGPQGPAGEDGTIVSGTNDGTNWTSLTIDGDTYGLADSEGLKIVDLSSYSSGTTLSQEVYDEVSEADAVIIVPYQKIICYRTIEKINVNTGNYFASPVVFPNGWNSYTDAFNGQTYKVNIEIDRTFTYYTADTLLPRFKNVSLPDNPFIWKLEKNQYGSPSATYTHIADVALSGDYDDLTNKPTIPDVSNMVTTDTGQIITGSKWIQGDLTIMNQSGINLNDVDLYVNDTNDNKAAEYSADHITLYSPSSTSSSYLQIPAGKGSDTLACLSDVPTVPTKTSDLTNDSGFITNSALTGYATETYVDDAIAGIGNVFVIKGSVATVSDLPASGNTIGDVYYVASEQAGYVWIEINNVPQWEELGPSIDLSSYAQLSDLTWSNISNKPNFATVATSGSYTDLSNKPTIPTVPTNVSAFTNDAGYITNSALTGYATETWVGQQGYITGITSNDVTTALGYTPYNSSNPDGYITGITSGMVVNALGYTPGTSNFSGDYNDLTNKPTIPPAVSGTNDGTNWTTLTVGSDTYAIPQGGSSTVAWADITNKPTFATVATSGDYDDLTNKPDLSVYALSANLASVATSGDYDDLTNKPTIPTTTNQLYNDSGFITINDVPTNYVTTNTAQIITGNKTLKGVGLYFQQAAGSTNAASLYLNGSILEFDAPYMEISSTNGVKVLSDLLPGVEGSGGGDKDIGSSSRRWNDIYLSGNISDGTNSITVANIASKANSETWTFTLSDNTTVTKTIVLG